MFSRNQSQTFMDETFFDQSHPQYTGILKNQNKKDRGGNNNNEVKESDGEQEEDRRGQSQV